MKYQSERSMNTGILPESRVNKQILPEWEAITYSIGRLNV